MALNDREIFTQRNTTGDLAQYKFIKIASEKYLINANSVIREVINVKRQRLLSYGGLARKNKTNTAE